MGDERRDYFYVRWRQSWSVRIRAVPDVATFSREMPAGHGKMQK